MNHLQDVMSNFKGTAQQLYADDLRTYTQVTRDDLRENVRGVTGERRLSPRLGIYQSERAKELHGECPVIVYEILDTKVYTVGNIDATMCLECVVYVVCESNQPRDK